MVFRQVSNKRTALLNIFDWHFQSWRLDKKYLKKTKDGEITSLDWINYSLLQTNLLNLIQQIQTQTLINNSIYWSHYIETLKNHIDDNIEQKVEVSKDNYHYYLDSFDIWENFFDNVYKSSQYSQIERLNMYFPGEWRTSLENKNNLLSRIWYQNLIIWLHQKINQDINTAEYTELSRSISCNLNVFFRDYYKGYIAEVFLYWSEFHYLDSGRILKMIEAEPKFTIELDKEYFARKSKEIEDKQNKTVELIVMLFREMFEKNIKADMVEIAELEKDNDLDSRQKNRLGRVSEVWSRIYEEMKQNGSLDPETSLS